MFKEKTSKVGTPLHPILKFYTNTDILNERFLNLSTPAWLTDGHLDGHTVRQRRSNQLSASSIFEFFSDLSISFCWLYFCRLLETLFWVPDLRLDRLYQRGGGRDGETNEWMNERRRPEDHRCSNMNTNSSTSVSSNIRPKSVLNCMAWPSDAHSPQTLPLSVPAPASPEPPLQLSIYSRLKRSCSISLGSQQH